MYDLELFKEERCKDYELLKWKIFQIIWQNQKNWETFQLYTGSIILFPKNKEYYLSDKMTRLYQEM